MLPEFPLPSELDYNFRAIFIALCVHDVRRDTRPVGDVRPMNILFMRPRADSGGASRHMHALASALAERGHHVMLAVSGGEWLAHFSSFPISLVPLYPSTPVHWLLSAARLARLVRIENIHVMHSHHRFTTMVGRLISHATGVPLVCTVHEFKTNWRWLSSLWLARWVCAPSRALREHLIRFNALAPERVAVVQLGPPPIHPDPAIESRVRRLCGGDCTGPLIAYVGRLAPEKGVDILLRALPEVFHAHPEARAVIVGGGPERRALEALAQLLGVAERVRWAGERADAPQWMAAMSVVAAPSRSENFSLTIAEAMAAARPVVAAAVGGLPEMVEDGVTGYLVPPDDPAMLARRLVEVLSDPSRAAAMGMAGRRKAAEWSPACAAEVTEQVYRHALSQVSLKV
jgi:glycosyltransferase involved in cell wall biosynthesis